MPTIVVRIDVTDVDPTRNDPADIAADIVETYNEDLTHRADSSTGPAKLLSAEWAAWT